MNVDVDRTPGAYNFDFKFDVPKTQSMSLLLDLIAQLKSRDYVDASNMLVMGLSMGAMGTYDLLSSSPNDFKAAVAICGGAHPKLASLMNPQVPVWAFHGDQDDVVPLSASEIIVDAINSQGGQAMLTVYEGVGHDSWNNAFAEPELMSWLFKHVDSVKQD